MTGPPVSFLLSSPHICLGILSTTGFIATESIPDIVSCLINVIDILKGI
jgi:hypothetical protein